MDVVLDIIKVTLPALIVFLTVYYLFKQYMQQQMGLEQLKLRNKEASNVLPLKLQAYERLMLFCERIHPVKLALRLNHKELGGKELTNAMLIAIEQEFEHNLTQQIYISEQLWSIIRLAKNQIQQIISDGNGSTPNIVIENIQKIMEENKADPLEYAKSAIRKEAQLLLQ